AKLTQSHRGGGVKFARRVALSGDTAVMGADGSVISGFGRSGAAYVFGPIAPPPTPTPDPVGGIGFDPELSALPAVEAAPPAENVGAINGVRVFARIRPVAVAALSLSVAVALWWLRTRRA
ncbi:MAG: FG-GAP repeat protein, partial [Chloroflexi bacterium]|nr:FG-GAP repeat protein [Chloroflexota bacterium]